MKYLATFILNAIGWQIKGEIPPIEKMVVISAPHTSMWDFVIGRLSYSAIGIKPSVMIKEELFFFPLGCFLKKIGGISVSRGKKTDIIDKMVELFNTNQNFCLTITPEGTRKLVKEWKTGFYVISMKAQVPIIPTYFDYKKKEIGILSPIYPTGDMKNEIKAIRRLYDMVTPRHKNLFDRIQE